MPKYLQLQGEYPLSVSLPDEPSNILWEHLDATKTDKLIKRLLSAIIVIVLMCATFLIIMIANIYNTDASKIATCPSTTPSQSQATGNSTLTACFCASYSYSTILSDNSLRNFCLSYFIQTGSQMGLTVASAFVVVIVN